jgi:hypothetical protein
MRLDPRASAKDLPKLRGEKGVPEPRRRTGRLPQESLMCNLGLILDLSVGGMRILCRKAPTHPVEIEITGHTLPGKLIATLAWSKKVGLFKTEIGLRFEKVTAEMATCLTQIAAINRFRRVI